MFFMPFVFSVFLLVFEGKVGKLKKMKVAKKPKLSTTIKKKGKPKDTIVGRKIKKMKILKTEKTQNGEKKKRIKDVELPHEKPSKKVESRQPQGKKTKKKVKKSHQQDLEGLKDIDPEFYEFLKKNDKELLDFNLDSDESDEEEELNSAKKPKEKKRGKEKGKTEIDSQDDSDEDFDNDGDENDDGDDDDDDDDDDKFHQPVGQLEVASDESDFEGDDEDVIEGDGTQKVTLHLLRQWQLELEKPNVSIDVVRKVVQAFSSALASITVENDQQGAGGGGGGNAFKVVGGAAFNGVVQLCVLHLQPAILRVLGVTEHSKIPLHKTKKWVKVRSCLRYYLQDLIRLIEQVSSANILSVLLKHLHQMSHMVASFSTLGKSILKRLIVLWATGDETVRVLAFLCILKITRNQQVSMLNHVLKAMYLSYVRNSKFVSPNTLPGINFMRRSLVEMFALDLNVSYQHAFLYIRQLAIHLRNAVILKKKDSFQAIYNWQYINSLRLWADLLGATANRPQLQPLIYPLVTITIGVIRLIPTAQYFPLRFHCIQSLMVLAKETNTFIPLLPLILEVLRSNTFNRKHTAVSMRPLQFTCVLRLNKTQLAENGFRDEVIEQVCNLTLEYLAHESSTLAFSDLIVPTVIALKGYLKECHNANYSRKLKQLLDKMQENSRFIEQERRKINFGLQDLEKVRAWETQVRNKKTPLAIYYESWVKTHETKKRRQAAHIDEINTDYDVPAIKRKNKNEGSSTRNQNGDVELFPSDTDDEDDNLPNLPVDDNEIKKKSNKNKKNKDNKKLKSNKTVENNVDIDVPLEEIDDSVDIVKDLDLNDW